VCAAGESPRCSPSVAGHFIGHFACCGLLPPTAARKPRPAVL
jgi:hypothetical protein